MPTARIVEAVDVFENGDFDLSAGLSVSAPDHFGFEGFEKLSTAALAIGLDPMAPMEHDNCPFRTWTLSDHVFSGSFDRRANSIGCRGPCGECSPLGACAGQ
jgi:hypothetical protein